MVRVSGNAYRENLYGINDLDALELEDYLIDRCEVTNRQFKAFVDQGGYRDRKYWKQSFLDGKMVLSWEDALSKFRDQTGKPGPSPWQSGTYPAGEDNYPVRGVSWYEAAAYAEFTGKSLPTVVHWSRASGHHHSGEITPLSNFASSGPAPVDRSEGLGPFGTLAMAGNVREWCWNKSDGDRRFILGGAWDSPPYLFFAPDTASAFDRTPANGFSCVRYLSDKVPAKAFEDIPVVVPGRDYTKETPAPDPVFQVYKSFYAYHKAPLHAQTETSSEESMDCLHQTVAFDAAYGKERVRAHLYLPRQSKSPHQAVVFFPGGNYFVKGASFPGGNLPSEIAFIVRSGRAVLWPVYKGSCERRGEELPDDPIVWRSRGTEVYQDLARSVDYLEERRDIDGEKIAYYGLSGGAKFGPIYLALDDRFKVAVLAYGGLPLDERPRPEIDFIHFAPRVRVPVLMINSRNDPIYPYETSQLPMFNLLGTPQKDKQHLPYAVSGHAVPQEKFETAMLSWLDQYLGKVRSKTSSIP
jgi:cephalosporin-C deacetylase-like acetyl esterase